MTRLVRVGDFSRKKRTNIFRSRSEKYYIFRKVKNCCPGRGVSCREKNFSSGRIFENLVALIGKGGKGEVGIGKWRKGSMVERVARHLAISKQRNRKFSQTRYACSFYDGPLTRKPGRGTGQFTETDGSSGLVYRFPTKELDREFGKVERSSINEITLYRSIISPKRIPFTTTVSRTLSFPIILRSSTWRYLSLSLFQIPTNALSLDYFLPDNVYNFSKI